MEPDEVNFIDGLPRTRQLLARRGVPPQPPGDALDGPGEALTRLDGHEAMHNFGEDRGRGEAGDPLIRDPVEELLASCAVARMNGEVVEEYVGVHEDCLTRKNGIKGHGPSSGSVSASWM